MDAFRTAWLQLLAGPAMGLPEETVNGFTVRSYTTWVLVFTGRPNTFISARSGRSLYV